MTTLTFKQAIEAMGGTVRLGRLGDDDATLIEVTFDGRRWSAVLDSADTHGERLEHLLRQVRDAARGHNVPARPEWEYQQERAIAVEREDPSIDYSEVD